MMDSGVVVRSGLQVATIVSCGGLPPAVRS